MNTISIPPARRSHLGGLASSFDGYRPFYGQRGDPHGALRLSLSTARDNAAARALCESSGRVSETLFSACEYYIGA